MTWRDWKRRPQLQVPLARPIDGWRQGAPDVYTCVAPAGYEKDPAVTAAIHEFDPGAIPLWRVQTWLPPQSMKPLLVVHHGIGRFYPYPRYLRQAFHVEMPQLATHPAPNFLEAIFADHAATNYRGPAGYQPWDWERYEWCRAQFVYLTVEGFERRLERKQKEKDRLLAAIAAEREYRMRDFERFANKKLADVTPADWAAYQELLKAGRRGGRRRAVSSLSPQ